MFSGLYPALLLVVLGSGCAAEHLVRAQDKRIEELRLENTRQEEGLTRARQSIDELRAEWNAFVARETSIARDLASFQSLVRKLAQKVEDGDTRRAHLEERLRAAEARTGELSQAFAQANLSLKNAEAELLALRMRRLGQETESVATVTPTPARAVATQQSTAPGPGPEPYQPPASPGLGGVVTGLASSLLTAPVLGGLLLFVTGGALAYALATRSRGARSSAPASPAAAPAPAPARPRKVEAKPVPVKQTAQRPKVETPAPAEEEPAGEEELENEEDGEEAPPDEPPGEAEDSSTREPGAPPAAPANRPGQVQPARVTPRTAPARQPLVSRAHDEGGPEKADHGALRAATPGTNAPAQGPAQQSPPLSQPTAAAAPAASSALPDLPALQPARRSPPRVVPRSPARPTAPAGPTAPAAAAATPEAAFKDAESRSLRFAGAAAPRPGFRLEAETRPDPMNTEVILDGQEDHLSNTQVIQAPDEDVEEKQPTAGQTSAPSAPEPVAAPGPNVARSPELEDTGEIPDPEVPGATQVLPEHAETDPDPEAPAPAPPLPPAPPQAPQPVQARTKTFGAAARPKKTSDERELLAELENLIGNRIGEK